MTPPNKTRANTPEAASLDPAYIKARKKERYAKLRFKFEIYVIPVLLGATIASILFVLLPTIIHFYLAGNPWEVAFNYASDDFSDRIDLLMHGDFSHYKDWAFPAVGAAIGIFLKALYSADY